MAIVKELQTERPDLAVDSAEFKTEASLRFVPVDPSSFTDGSFFVVTVTWAVDGPTCATACVSLLRCVLCARAREFLCE